MFLDPDAATSCAGLILDTRDFKLLTVGQLFEFQIVSQPDGHRIAINVRGLDGRFQFLAYGLGAPCSPPVHPQYPIQPTLGAVPMCYRTPIGAQCGYHVPSPLTPQSPVSPQLEYKGSSWNDVHSGHCGYNDYDNDYGREEWYDTNGSNGIPSGQSRQSQDEYGISPKYSGYHMYHNDMYHDDMYHEDMYHGDIYHEPQCAPTVPLETEYAFGSASVHSVQPIHGEDSEEFNNLHLMEKEDVKEGDPGSVTEDMHHLSDLTDDIIEDIANSVIDEIESPKVCPIVLFISIQTFPFKYFHSNNFIETQIL